MSTNNRPHQSVAARILPALYVVILLVVVAVAYRSLAPVGLQSSIAKSVNDLVGIEILNPGDVVTEKSPTPSPGIVPAGEYADMLGSLTVRDKQESGDYDRVAQFGASWPDNSDTGCDERNTVLQRDLTEIDVDGNGCVVWSGTLEDPYTGEIIEFERGVQTSGAVQIDHVVALKDVWVSGGRDMTQDQRLAVANDLDNLLAADGPTNGSKSASDASEWMPPNAEFHCTYAQMQISVKSKYALSVTQSEQEALRDALATCV